MNQPSCWPHHLDCDHRDAIGSSCTLNGQPAKVVKDVKGRAWIAPLDTAHGSVPYSWTGVWNILANHKGRF